MFLTLHNPLIDTQGCDGPKSSHWFVHVDVVSCTMVVSSHPHCLLFHIPIAHFLLHIPSFHGSYHNHQLPSTKPTVYVVLSKNWILHSIQWCISILNTPVKKKKTGSVLECLGSIHFGGLYVEYFISGGWDSSSFPHDFTIWPTSVPIASSAFPRVR